MGLELTIIAILLIVIALMARGIFINEREIQALRIKGNINIKTPEVISVKEVVYERIL